MSPPVFLAEGAQLAADRVVLAGAEGRHAASVRRLRPGERVDLTDGAGLLAECVVVTASRGELDLRVENRRREPPRTPRFTVVQALPKGDRGELAVEMMTEAGVDRVVPWAAARCVTQWRAERGAKALERWRNASRAAVKQSRGRWLPEVTGLATTAEVADRVAAAPLAVIMHEDAETPLSAIDPPRPGGPGGGEPGVGEPGPAAEIVIVVGPEGGLTAAELAAFTRAGGTPVRLGPTVLRTSTAGLAAAAVLLSRTGRW